jgi:lambda family phage tail tape measure protein
MTTVATLDTVLRLNSAAFRQGMIGAAAQANASLSSIQKKAAETASVLLQLKRAANTFGSFYLVKEGVASLIEAQKQLQSIQYTLQAATGSSTVAADALAFVRKEAAQLGLVIPDAAEGFAKLSASATAAGVSMNDQKELFDAYAKSSATLHLSATQSSRALLALEQMFAKGKIQAQELRLQLGQAIPGAAQRFQNAVMEMTKGTNLAGKSFDQLLEAGDLTTSKFLPALVSALRDSGRGWQDAAHGLNAELNRVQTAWFNLKSEVSGGLFGDAVTVGARLLANNLDSIASSITLIGGGALARVLGTQLASGAGKVQRLAEEVRGSQMAAAAEAQYTEKTLAAASASTAHAEAAALENQVVKDLAADALADAKAREIEAFGIKEVALAEMQRLEAAAALNETLATGTAAKRAQAEIDARLAATSEALVMAERQMTKAVIEQTAARNTLAMAEEREAALRAGVTVAAETEAAAQAAATAAKEASLALGGVGAAALRAAKSFGSFALGLVGGPWGAAVLGIGAVSYAIYEGIKAHQEYERETQNEVQSLVNLRTELQATAEDYGKLHAAKNYSQALDVYNGSADQVQKLRDELDKLTADRDALDKAMASGHAGALAGQNMDDLNARIKALQEQLQPTEAQLQSLGAELSTNFVVSVDAAKAALERFKQGATMADVLGAFGDAVDAGRKQADDLKATIDSDSAALQAMGKSLANKILTDGKTNEQIAQARLDQQLATIKQQKLGQAQINAQLAAATQEAAPILDKARQADAADAAKKAAEAAKSAAKQQKEAYDSVVKSAFEKIATEREQLEGESKLTDAEKFRAKVLSDIDNGNLKVSGSAKAYLLALLDTGVALAKANKEEAEHQRSLALTAALEDQLASRLQNRRDQNAINAAGYGLGTEEVQQMQDELRIKQDYQRQIDQLNKQANKEPQGSTNAIGGADYKQRLADIQRAQAEETALYRQGVDDRLKAEADWKNGAEAAWLDYRDKARDVASQVRDLTTTAFQDMEDSIVNFATTGKFQFKSFATDVLKEIVRIETRILISKAVSAILGMFAGSTAPSGAGDSLNGGANYTGPGSLSTSWGGGRALGGPVQSNTMYEVAEGGKPELLSMAGRTYLMTGQSGGHVTPASAAGGGGSAGGANVSVAVNVQVTQQSDGSTSSKTSTDSNKAAGKELGDMMASVAEQAISKAMRPGGQIWKLTVGGTR